VKTVAVCNQKGGVGKTTITLGLASAGAAEGVRVLVIDLDPQANATGALLPEFDGARATRPTTFSVARAAARRRRSPNRRHGAWASSPPR
jgi:cellulose biosynthesis protein BcsQ